jgi:NADH-quinone oxidoreductase subunit F
MKIIIGKGSCGIAAGANKVAEQFREKAAAEGLHIEVATTGCIGMCYLEPIVEVAYDNGEKKTYVRVHKNEAVEEILKSLTGAENQAAQYLLSEEDEKVMKRQTKVALKNCGLINPECIDDYIGSGGYEALKKCLAMSPEAVIDEVKAAGIGGRGGAGFPTWFKWNAARSSAGDLKYIICNADEGDPGAFMDRAIIEGDPHCLIEGMIICAYAICSPSAKAEGAVYVRAEYPLAIIRLEKAIAAARERGFLGENILGSSFAFDLKIKAGAGAFVCGEETALIASLEGERGMPRLKPPFPAQSGFWGKPSNINNVETYANIPWILRNGSAAFAAMGTEGSKGTKVFALTGKIKKGGLVEIPMGSTIREVIFDIGGGIKENKAFKAVQMGGPSGGCIPAEKLDTVIDYKSISATGAIMGSGGMVVMDEGTCMVGMARFFLDFTCKESCGKCTHCRIGTKRMLEILDRMTAGAGKDGDIELLEELSQQIKAGALCGLGQTAPNPVLTTIRYFRNEYEDHIKGKCTAKQCKAMITWSIDAEKCIGCSLCARKCPSDAISGVVKSPYVIDQEKCTKCDICRGNCKFDAIVVE